MVLSMFLFVVCFGGFSTFCGMQNVQSSMNGSRDSATVNVGTEEEHMNENERDEKKVCVESKMGAKLGNFISNLWSSIELVVLYFYYCPLIYISEIFGKKKREKGRKY